MDRLTLDSEPLVSQGGYRAVDVAPPRGVLRLRRSWRRKIRFGDTLTIAGRERRVRTCAPDGWRHLLVELEPLHPSPLDEVLERVAVRETAKGA